MTVDIAPEASVSPAPVGTLHDRVYDLLHELGRSPAPVIAGELAEMGMHGIPGTAMHPLTEWLLRVHLDYVTDSWDDVHRDRTPELAQLYHHAWLEPGGVRVIGPVVDGYREEALVPLPPPVAMFAADFDCGIYPELVIDDPTPTTIDDPTPTTGAPLVDDRPDGCRCYLREDPDYGELWHRPPEGCPVHPVETLADVLAQPLPVVHLAPAEPGGCSECGCIETCEAACRWANMVDLEAAGLDPEQVLVPVCTACLPHLVAAADAQARAHAEAALPAAPGADLAELEEAADAYLDAWVAQSEAPAANDPELAEDVQATGRVTPVDSHTAQLPVVPRDAGPGGGAGGAAGGGGGARGRRGGDWPAGDRGGGGAAVGRRGAGGGGTSPRRRGSARAPPTRRRRGCPSGGGRAWVSGGRATPCRCPRCSCGSGLAGLPGMRLAGGPGQRRPGPPRMPGLRPVDLTGR